MASAASKPIRALNAFEAFTDACMVHRNLCMAQAVTLKSSRKIEFDHVEKALKLLQKEHMQLGICINRTVELVDSTYTNPINWLTGVKKKIMKCEFWTVAHPQVPLQCIKLRSNSNWKKDILETAIQTTFEDGDLLWKAIWLESVEHDHSTPIFIMICHPSIADARGTLLLVDQFLANLDEILQEKHDDNVGNNKIAETLPNVETSFDPDHTNISSYDVLSVANHFARSALSRWKSAYISQNPVPLIPDFTTRHIPFNVTTQQSKSILKQLKERGVSLQALWTAAASIALHRMMKIPKDQPQKFLATYEANLRTFCNKELEPIKHRLHGGWWNYIEESLETTGDDSQPKFWDFVSSVQDSISKQLNSNITMVKMLPYIFGKMGSPYEMFSSLGINRSTRNDYAIVMYEDVDKLIGDRETFEIAEVSGSIASFSMGSPFKHVAYVYKDKINYTMTYFGNYTTKDEARKFGQKTLDILINACSKAN